MPRTGRKHKPIEEVQWIIDALIKYTDSTQIPIVAEFAYRNNIRRDYLYNHPAFDDAMKRLVDKKEANLERLALRNRICRSMAIFSLKQLGWRDRQDVDFGLDYQKIAEGFAKMVFAAGAGLASSPDQRVPPKPSEIQDGSRGPAELQDGDSQTNSDSGGIKQARDKSVLRGTDQGAG